MTKEKATETFGAVVFENSRCVVRLRPEEHGVSIAVNNKQNGSEELPLGYLEGINHLTYGYKKESK